MRDEVIKIKLMNKNKRHSGLKMSSVETRTAHIIAETVLYGAEANV
jgi:hypothetical protein